MKVEIGKCYQLNPDKYYFSTDLQRNVKFTGNVTVKVDAEYKDKLFFGYLIRNADTYSDIISNDIIEFETNDVISEYECHPGYFPYIEHNL